MLVPGLAFDARGYRLGRGAGHYDRLLPTLRPDAPRWALALDCQLVEGLPIEPHDVPIPWADPADDETLRRAFTRLGPASRLLAEAPHDAARERASDAVVARMRREVVGGRVVLPAAVHLVAAR